MSGLDCFLSQASYYSLWNSVIKQFKFKVFVVQSQVNNYNQSEATGISIAQSHPWIWVVLLVINRRSWRAPRIYQSSSSTHLMTFDDFYDLDWNGLDDNIHWTLSEQSIESSSVVRSASIEEMSSMTSVADLLGALVGVLNRFLHEFDEPGANIESD